MSEEKKGPVSDEELQSMEMWANERANEHAAELVKYINRLITGNHERSGTMNDQHAQQLIQQIQQLVNLMRQIVQELQGIKHKIKQ